VISDVRDPLEELASHEIVSVRQKGEEKFNELADKIEALEAERERYQNNKMKDTQAIDALTEARYSLLSPVVFYLLSLIFYTCFF
jgi:acetyl-CoA carboxylase alpha subunit